MARPVIVTHFNDSGKFVQSFIFGQTVSKKIIHTLHTNEIAFTVFFNNKLHDGVIVLHPAPFSSSEAVDRFLDALEHFFFAEDGEDGGEVGAGLLTGNGDAHGRHNRSEA